MTTSSPTTAPRAKKVATKKVTASRTPKQREPVKCTRFPCDTAYRRGTHTPRENGGIQHTTKVDSDLDLNTADEWETRWAVEVVAFDDRPWRQHVYLMKQSHVFDPELGERFTQAVTRSALWASKYNLEDAQAGFSA